MESSVVSQEKQVADALRQKAAEMSTLIEQAEELGLTVTVRTARVLDSVFKPANPRVSVGVARYTSQHY